ncbi:SDR family NAD(P)-dependent oxidoreductase [Swingsia samuiensis]|uniref:SDR family NAD(P)-dependent oxidoreductase n=1 Tax=Swingsia samuiensis TaxID=1293412 RepID=A0A4Y6UNU2_9PROT|nr:SDR family NAD(P)-dependent oxidoreductase [Swingsia samuiensis]QDH17725.1 SDR family NAD(P)-dependent oxidoreductase [Swingsia samuiensis]
MNKNLPFSGEPTLSQPIALLTGASGGIGKELTHFLLKQGYHVVLPLRNLEKAYKIFGKEHKNITYIECDLSQQLDLGKVSRAVHDLGGRVEKVIHCAGCIAPENIDAIQSENVTAQLTINLYAPILLTTELYPFFRKGTHIVFVNSVAGALPLEGSSIYTASKFGLRGFARALQLDVRKKGIGVSSIFLGAVDTPMLEKEMEDGGSILNFVSQPADPYYVAKLIMKLSRTSGKELFLPRIDGFFAHACLLMPWLLRLSSPILMYFGKRGLLQFQKKRAK